MSTASKLNRYVVMRRDGGWDVVKEGHRRASARAGSKDEAVRTARRLTRRDGGGEVQVINRSGKIANSDTVSRPKRRARAA